MTKIEKISIISAIIGLCLIWFSSQITSAWKSVAEKQQEQQPVKEHIDYYETTVVITYNDLRKDTVTVNIYDQAVFTLKNGDLTYWKITGATGGSVAGITTIASYVRSYSVIKSVHLQKF